MTLERILIPIDSGACPVEAFGIINGFAKRPGITVILLQVVDLNIMAPENRIYEELGSEAGRDLERLARKYMHPGPTILIHVRVGKPGDEILAEAKAQKVDLIVLPVLARSFWKHRASFWQHLLALIYPGLPLKLLRAAPCSLWIVHGETPFNCRDQWGRPEPAADPALSRASEAATMRFSPAFAPGDSPVAAPERDRLAA